MKRKNPYILVAVLWLLTSAIDTVSCVVQMYGDNRILALVYLVCAVAFGFVGGINFQKACEIAQLNAQAKWLHGIAQELAEMAKIQEQIKNNERIAV